MALTEAQQEELLQEEKVLIGLAQAALNATWAALDRLLVCQLLVCQVEAERTRRAVKQHRAEVEKE